MRMHLPVLVLLSVFVLVMIGCPPTSHKDIYEGSAAAGDDDDDLVGGTCAQYCDEICACDGVDEAFEAAGMGDCATWCADAVSDYEAAGNADEACEAALQAFNSMGGCDQYVGVGDDDTD